MEIFNILKYLNIFEYLELPLFLFTNNILIHICDRRCQEYY